MRRRAERFLRWADWHTARRGTLTEEKCARKLTDVLLGSGRYLRADAAKEHKRLVEAMMGAMPDVLEVSKSLPHDAPLRKSLDRLNHAVTRALIREGL